MKHARWTDQHFESLKVDDATREAMSKVCRLCRAPLDSPGNCPGPKYLQSKDPAKRISSWLRFSIFQTLRSIGSEAECRDCGEPIFWVRTKNDKSMPVEPDGPSHFSFCPAADRRRRR